MNTNTARQWSKHRGENCEQGRLQLSSYLPSSGWGKDNQYINKWMAHIISVSYQFYEENEKDKLIERSTVRVDTSNFDLIMLKADDHFACVYIPSFPWNFSSVGKSALPHIFLPSIVGLAQFWIPIFPITKYIVLVCSYLSIFFYSQKLWYL